MKTATYTLPAHWDCYFAYGDATDLDDGEATLIDRFMEDNCLLGMLDSTEEPEWRRTHDASGYGVLACNCLDYTFPVKEGA